MHSALQAHRDQICRKAEVVHLALAAKTDRQTETPSEHNDWTIGAEGTG